MDEISTEKQDLKGKGRRGRRDVWEVMMGEYKKVALRAQLFSVSTATLAGTVGYYRGGWKLGALHGYSTMFGALPVGLFVYSVLEVVQDRRGGLPPNFKDYMMVCGSAGVLTGSVIGMMASRRVSASALMGLKSGLVWAAAGGAYKAVGDELWERSRNHWIQLRVNHSLPEDDGTVPSNFRGLDEKDKKFFHDIMGAYKKLFTEGKFPEPKYGPLAKAKREDIEEEIVKQLEAEKLKKRG